MQFLQRLNRVQSHSMWGDQSRAPSQVGSTLLVAFVQRSAVVCCCLWSLSVVHADGLVQIRDQNRQYEGKVVSLSQSECSLIDRQGHLKRLPVADLKSVKKIAPRFQPLPSSTFRAKLQEEFSSGYEIAGSTHYFVCAPKGRAKQYVQLFESIYRDVAQFYRVRGFSVNEPEFPLVAIVFRSQAEFARYATKDKVPVSGGLLGYYSLLSNRVALFDSQGLVQSDSTIRPGDGLSNSILSETVASTGDGIGQETLAYASAIAGETTNTVVHETIHQVGYNIGIHSRVGGAPTWVVEGLATALEPSGMRKRTGRNLVSDRLNDERSVWFRDVFRERRPMGFLAGIVASDSNFHRNLLHAYSESWAFTFFLLENGARRQDLVDYLQLLSKRDPTKLYTAKQRLAEFEKAFGDISRLEVEFIRFMDRM